MDATSEIRRLTATHLDSEAALNVSMGKSADGRSPIILKITPGGEFMAAVSTISYTDIRGKRAKQLHACGA
jgi:hypothetical protein